MTKKKSVDKVDKKDYNKELDSMLEKPVEETQNDSPPLTNQNPSADTAQTGSSEPTSETSAAKLIKKGKKVQ